MPRIPGFPEKPHYNSVKAYLSELAKDIAEMVVEPVKMERFKEQLKIYADSWKQWSNYDEADRQGCWEPSMGRPECIFNIFSRSYNPLRDTEKGAKRLAGSYALCALIHDSQLPHLDKINTDIIPVEAVQETFSAPRNTLEARLVGNWNSGPDVREIYLIEEFFNRVTVDLREFCKSEENKLTQTSIEGQIQQASQLSDEEFLELTAKKFEERAKKVLSKDETWHDLDRSLKVWFGAAIERLEKHGFKNKTDLLKYLYKNLLHYAREVNIKNFRGFPDSRIVELAYSKASELAERFKEATRKNKENLPPNKTEENESGVIVDLLKKDYLLKTEDSFKEETAGIVQDFISRGLYNSTECTSKQLQAHFDHINKLLDHILELLKKDFADIPLKQIKEKLFTITDEEYKKLVPIANSHLVNAGLAQPDILKIVEQQINNKKKKAKQTIETRIAISEKQRASPKDKRELEEIGQENKDTKREQLGEMSKWYQTNTFKFVVIPLLGILVVGIPAWIALFRKPNQLTTANNAIIEKTNIFAEVTNEGTILRSKNFPWKITKTKNRNGNILYTIVDRRGDPTAISVATNNSTNEYFVHDSWGGLVIEFTCAEEKISNFTIKVKY